MKPTSWNCTRKDLCISQLYWSLYKDGMEMVPEFAIEGYEATGTAKLHKNYQYLATSEMQAMLDAVKKSDPFYLAARSKERWNTHICSYYRFVRTIDRSNLQEESQERLFQLMDWWGREKSAIFRYHIGIAVTMEPCYAIFIEEVKRYSKGEDAEKIADEMISGVKGIHLRELNRELVELLSFVSKNSNLRHKVSDPKSYKKRFLERSKGGREFYRRFLELQKKFAHLGPIEPYLKHWGDDPEILTGILADYISNNILPDEYKIDEVKQKRMGIETKKFLSRTSSGKRKRLRERIRFLRRCYALRENQHYQLTEGIWKLKQVIKETGKRLYSEDFIEDPDDVFFAFREELDHLNDLNSNILVKRREGYHKNLKITPPQVLGDGPALDIGGAPDMKMKRELEGLGVGAGIGGGKVVLVHNPGDYDRIKAGDVVVASKAAPELTLFCRKISGIVTDEGGRCCHAANLARHYGLPTVVGTKNATKFLRDGMQILVDSNAGKIKILEG